MPSIALVLGAGSGARMGSDIPKQFLQLAGEPVLAHTLRAFEACGGIDGIVVVAAGDWMDRTREIASGAAPTKLRAVVPGGATRQESSYLGVTALVGYPESTLVVIHDAARPLVTEKVIRDCLAATSEFGAAAVAVPSVDTIFRVQDSLIMEIPSRRAMYLAQTPQGFRLDLLRRAHEAARREGSLDATDDVRVVMRAGYPVRLVPGDPENIKLTHPNDLVLGEAILANRAGLSR